MRMRNISLILLIFTAFFSSFAKGEEPETTYISDPMIRSLTLTKNGDLMEIPVIGLDGMDNLVFSFDEITDDRRYLRCRLKHCDADWKESRLLESEYADGFNYDEIEDFGFSSNTYCHYVNYRYELGSESRLRPLVSGNYVWQVYDENDPDNVLLQARFRVSEDVCRVGGRADGRTDRGFNDEWQQLSLIVESGGDIIPNPYTDIVLEVEQNSRPDSSKLILHPQRVEGKKIIYDHLPQLIFPAGNEYRRFETVRADYPGMGVDSTRYIDGMYHAFLKPSALRFDKSYIFDSTQHGRYKIDEYNATDPDLGSDYILTHFTLDFPEIMDGEVFVEGDLSLRGYTDVNRMKYDRGEGMYKLTIPLKQGSYNYQYVVRKPDKNDPGINIGGGKRGRMAEGTPIEGNHYETLNEYNVYVYLRLPRSRNDRLLGYATIVATP